MSTLPRITPRGTPLSATLVHKSLPAVYDVYPARLPSAPDIRSRINVLAPNPPRKRRHVSMETTDRHWQNEQRSRLMQKREHYRYHHAWSHYYYGSPADQESYRSFMRTVLKQQMDDKVTNKKEVFKSRVQESERAQELDRQSGMEEAMKVQRKHEYLSTFRDANKQFMLERENTAKLNKSQEIKYDRELLHYNPINWSATLK